MYEKINNKDKSIKHFIEFVDFMFDNRHKAGTLNEKDRENLQYHFDNIPVYTREALGKLRYDLLGDISNIGVSVTRLKETVDKFTDLN